MDTQNIAIFTLCEDTLKTLHHDDVPQKRLSDPDVLDTAIAAVIYKLLKYIIQDKHPGTQAFLKVMKEG